MKLFDVVSLRIKLLNAEHSIDELNKKNKLLKDENTSLKKKIEETEEKLHRRYYQYEHKMKFLEKREKKLQEIETMLRNNEDFRVIKSYIKKRQDFEK